jgi:hypothetical protein
MKCLNFEDENRMSNLVNLLLAADFKVRHWVLFLPNKLVMFAALT